MKHKYTFSFFLGLFFTAVVMDSHAQPEHYNRIPAFLKANSVWFWGSWGFDFNEGGPSSFVSEPPSGVAKPQGTVKVSVADPVHGQLLFYTDGHDCYDATRKIMPDGQGLFGPGYTTAKKYVLQGACAVPVIGQEGKYYVFSMFGGEPFLYRMMRPKDGMLYYSVVDMSLNNGRGNVVAGQKHIVLDKDTALSSAMIAIPGNNCDVWLVVHTVGEPIFKAYHITEAGVNPNPVISVAGTQVTGSGQECHTCLWYAYSMGGMTVSPDRSKIVMSSIAEYYPPQSLEAYGVVVVNFDPNTGRVTEGIKIDNTTPFAHTLAFSPDGSKLYGMTGKWLGGQLFESDLVQYDLSTFSSTAVNASAVKLAQQRSTTVNMNGSAYIVREPANLKLYGDSIYIVQPMDSFFSTINRPNLQGLSSGYTEIGIPFTDTAAYGGKVTARGTFHSELVYPRGPLHTTARDTALCAEDLASGVTVMPSRGIHYGDCIWNTGAKDSLIRISEAGTYWVSYPALIGNCYSQVTDTIYVRVANPEEPVVTVNVDTLSTAHPYLTYQWYKDGRAIKDGYNRKLFIRENGNYHVVVTDENGCIDTSEVYVVRNQGTSVNLVQQGYENVRLYPNPVQRYFTVSGPGPLAVTVVGIDGKIVVALQNAGRIDMGACAPGMYWVYIRDRDERLISIQKLVKLP